MNQDPLQRLQALNNHLSPPNGDSAISASPTSGEAPSPRAMLERERKMASFKSLDLTHFLDGGKMVTDSKHHMMQLLERNPAMRPRGYDLTRLEQRELSLVRFIELVKLLNSQPDEESRRNLQILASNVDQGVATRLAVHFTLFLGAMRSQATPELYESLEKQGMVAVRKVLGSFAMTEMGHGSNVAGIETTAVLDLATDEFVIHTPTLTATKWWLGGVAMTATYTVVYAQMIIKEKNYGVKAFLVQLRDTETFEPMPGITLGDCGHKMGRNGLDNGWIQFSGVRIPRTNMLMKHASVDKDGTVKQAKFEQINYGPLVHGRVAILATCAESAKKAVTIAIRYGAVRRQFKAGKEGFEKPILDYTTHQYRLLPLLALTYAMQLTSVEMGSSTRTFMKKLASLNGTESKESVDEITETLKEMHGTSAGLKAYCTWGTLKLIEECRQSLGGHGYSSHSSLPQLYQDFAVNCSWEGDNTILTLQTGRYLINCWSEVKAGGTLKSRGVVYLNSYFRSPKRTSTASAARDLANPAALVDALSFAAAHLVVKAGERFHTVSTMTKDDQLAVQESGIEIMAGVRAHCQYYIADRFHSAVQRSPAHLKDVLSRLCALFAISCLHENIGALLHSGFFTPQQADLVQRQFFTLCQEIRQDAVALVDAFNLSDFLVESPLGARDGDVYERYFQAINQSTPTTSARPPFFDSALKPILSSPK